MVSLGSKTKKNRQWAGNYHEYDRGLVFAVLAVIIFGLIELLSASGVVAYAKFGDAY